MADSYFSDREFGPRARTQDEIPASVWAGLVALVRTHIADGSFAEAFPLLCPDGRGPYATDEQWFGAALCADIPDLPWPLREAEVPPTAVAMDLIEFCHQHVSKPVKLDYHGFFSHHHLHFQKEEGQADFRRRVNRIFSRNGLAYELQESGQVVRLAPPIVREALQSAVFRTGDEYLEALLEAARTKFLDPDAQVRRESLEKLWDAWERLKTVEPGGDKKASVLALLEKASAEPRFRALLEAEARELTDIGNSFMIRHTETDRVPIGASQHVDYLFHRMFAMIHLLLEARAGRISRSA